MSQAFASIVRASLSQQEKSDPQYNVMFNPVSLKVSLTNRLQDEDATGGGGQPRQNTRVTTSKLETELVYDTTDTGQDVRDKTSVLKKMAIAPPPAPGKPPASPPSVEFRWGRFMFVGVIESLSETLDFWAAEGIPLRATIQLVIQNVNGIADSNVENVPATATLGSVPAGGTGATGAATQAGDPRAGRSVAAANGIENMRMAAGGAVAVSAGVQLKAAAGFSLSAGASAGAGFGIGASAGARASAGAGFGIGASAGAGVSAGFGAGASAGFGASAAAGFGAGASAGFGASAAAGFGASASAGFGAGASAGFGAGAFATASFGASASAGVSASAGAFAGLGTSKTTGASFSLDPAKLLPQPTVTIGSGTQFDVTGRAIAGGASGLTADVGIRRVRFG